MNRWYQILEENCYIEHDKFCAKGVECFTRDKHVRSHYIPQALKHRVERLQFENKELRDKIDRVEQEPTDAECTAVLNAVTTPLGEEPKDGEWFPAAIQRCREAMMSARAARRDEEKRNG